MSSARPKFPGRVPGAGGVKRVRVRSSNVASISRESLQVGENVSRGLHAFYTMLGSEEEVRMTASTITTNRRRHLPTDETGAAITHELTNKTQSSFCC